jgi:hypothetical protein
MVYTIVVHLQSKPVRSSSLCRFASAWCYATDRVGRGREDQGEADRGGGGVPEGQRGECGTTSWSCMEQGVSSVERRCAEPPTRERDAPVLLVG